MLSMVAIIMIAVAIVAKATHLLTAPAATNAVNTLLTYQICPAQLSLLQAYNPVYGSYTK